MPENKFKKYSIHLLLFIVTLLSTTLAGAEWMTGRFFMGIANPLGLEDFWRGFHYSVPFLAILTVHEFGHYFTARYYRIAVSLPYYIPLWLTWLGIPSTIGTMGAFIRIQQRLSSNKEFFDVGIAGPLAGFVVALGVLFYGFTHLPPPEYIFEIHPDYAQYGLDYAQHVYNQPGEMFGVGTNLLFEFFKNYVAPDPSWVPNRYELFHYPYLFAGYLALFFTAINLIPIGQLDGGHIIFGMIGFRKHSLISPILFTLFIFYAGLGIIRLNYEGMFGDNIWLNNGIYMVFLYFAFSRTTEGFTNILLLSLSVFAAQFLSMYIFPEFRGNVTWLVFAFIIGRFLGVYHPPALYEEPLGTGRMILGWVAILVFILCFTPYPFVVD